MHSSFRSFIRIVALAVVLCVFVGCGSLDKYEYVSTPHLPTTVSLMNTANDQVFWKMDIPVGHKLKMDFDRPGDFDFIKVGKTPANEFEWELEPMAGGPVKTGTETLDGLPFVVKVNYRTPGELPVALNEQRYLMNSNHQLATETAEPAATANQPQVMSVVQNETPIAISPAPTPIEPISVTTVQPTEARPPVYQSPESVPAEPIAITVTPSTTYEPAPVYSSADVASTPPPSSSSHWESPEQVDEDTAATTAAMPAIVTTSEPEPQPVATMITPEPVTETPAEVDSKWITSMDEPPAASIGVLPEPVAEPFVVEASTTSSTTPEKIDLDALFGQSEPTPTTSETPTQVIELTPIRSTVIATPAPQSTSAPVDLSPIDNVYQSPPQPEVEVPTPTVENPVLRVESSERIAAPDTVPTFERKPLAPPPPMRFDLPSPNSMEPQLSPQSAAPAVEPQAAAGDADGYRRVPVKIQSQLLAQYDAKTVSILVEGVPRDATLSSGRNNGSGIWTLRGDEVANLNLKLPTRVTEDVQLMVIATAPTVSGDTASSIANMTLRVAPTATVPVEATNPWR